MTGMLPIVTDRATLRPDRAGPTDRSRASGSPFGDKQSALPVDCAWRLELAHALHTTLELPRMVEILGRHGAAIVDHDAVAFAASDAAVRVVCGRPGTCLHRVHLRLAERSIGHLSFSRRRPFELSEIATLEAMCADLAHPLDNALRHREAHEAATRDPLTGASNRGLLECMLGREVGLVRRHGGTLALLMIDIDRFKQVNDRFGHAAGDRSLVAVAACIAGCIRGSDTLFRYGGEEFCVLLPRTGTRGAWRVAERIRRAIGSLRIPAGTQDLRLSASLGAASLTPGDGAADLLREADAALYRSKQSGRDRISICTSEG